MDHNWPGDLDLNAECSECGLKYGQWSDPETLECQGSPAARRKEEERWA